MRIPVFLIRWLPAMIVFAAFFAGSLLWSRFGDRDQGPEYSPERLPETFYHLSTVITGGEWAHQTEFVSFSNKQLLEQEKSLLYSDFLSSHGTSKLPPGFIGQEFCTDPKTWSTIIAGGNFGTGPNALWSARLLELSFDVDVGVKPKLVANSNEYRFRDCAFGKVGNRNLFASVTQGEWYLYLYDLTGNSGSVVHLPYFGKENNSQTTMHFVEFADLDEDGNDEIYLTATTPEYLRFDNTSRYQEWTVYQVNVNSETGVFVWVKDVGMGGKFVKRLKKFSYSGNNALLVGFEGQLNDDGSIRSPFEIHALDYRNGQLSYVHVASLPHKECKEFGNYVTHPWKTSLQIGCDNGTLYEFALNETLGKFENVFQFHFWKERMEWDYKNDTDLMAFWDIVQTHAVFGDDIDGDGADELLVWVNNTGLYFIDTNAPGQPYVKELFRVGRKYPETFGRLVIFAAWKIEKRPGAAPLSEEPFFLKWHERGALEPFGLSNRGRFVPNSTPFLSQ